jgi:hypothetical protein
MKTYLLKLSGSDSSLEMARVFALRFFSSFRIVSGFAYVRWICETGSIEDVMEDINVTELERLGVNIEFFA